MKTNAIIPMVLKLKLFNKMSPSNGSFFDTINIQS